MKQKIFERNVAGRAAIFTWLLAAVSVSLPLFFFVGNASAASLATASVAANHPDTQCSAQADAPVPNPPNFADIVAAPVYASSEPSQASQQVTHQIGLMKSGSYNSFGLNGISNLPATGKNTYESLASGGTMVNISFHESGGSSDDFCKGTLGFWKNTSDKGNTVYGWWRPVGSSAANTPNSNQTFNLLPVTGTIDLASKSITFNLPSFKTVTMLVADDNNALEGYFGSGSTGGGGTASAGSSPISACWNQYHDAKKCFGDGSEAKSSSGSLGGQHGKFTDIGHINYGNVTFVLSAWNSDNSGNHLLYKLDPSSTNDASLKALNPYFDVVSNHSPTQYTIKDNTDPNAFSNFDSSLNYASPTQIAFNVDNSSDLVYVDAGSKNLFFQHYKNGDVIAPVLTGAADTNDGPYSGTYEKSAANTYEYKAGGFTQSSSGTACTALPTISLDSAIAAGSFTAAEWTIPIHDSGCDLAHIHVTVYGNPTSAAAPAVAPPATPDTAAANSVSCTSSSDGKKNPGSGAPHDFDWLLCPAVTGTVYILGQLNGVIDNLMTVGSPGTNDSPCQIFGNTSGSTTCNGQQSSGSGVYHAVWAAVRDISLGFLVVGGLIGVIAQSLGFELIDAYTLRKILPRIFIVAIGMTLSWPLMQFFVTFTNDLGLGISSLISGPFAAATNTATANLRFGAGTADVTSLLAGGTGFAILGAAGMLSFALTALLALAIAVLVLILRQLVIIALIILAPVAIASYILPNTSKLYKFWWDSFSKALMMFPLVSILIEVGFIFAYVAQLNGKTVSGPGSIIYTLLAFAGYVLPYFLIPLTFRYAGGVLSTLGGMVNDRGKGAFDRLSKFRANKTAQNMHAMREGNRYKGDNFASNAFNRATRNAALLPSAGINPAKMGSRIKAAGSRNEMSEMAEYMDKNADFKAIMGNDDYLQATMHNMGGGSSESDWRRYLTNHGYEGASLEQGVAAIRSAKRGTSNEVFERAAVVANASTGTGWKEGGAAQMMQSINGAAGGDRDTAARMLAEVRTRATQARRVDLGGAGYGTTQAAMNDLYAGNITESTANQRVYDNALWTQGPGAIAGARGDSVKLMAPAMVDRLKVAHARYDAAGPGQEKEIAKRDLAQEYAAVAGRYDVLSHAAPENASIMADSVMSEEINGMTFREAMEGYRTNPQFLEARRELSASGRQENDSRSEQMNQGGDSGRGMPGSY